MHPIFICLSVFLLSQVLECYDGILTDESDHCYNGRNITNFMTTGAGMQDSHVLMIAKPDDIKCTIHFFVSKGNYIMLVVEFIDWIKGNLQCGGWHNQVKVMVSKHIELNVCYKVKDTHANIFRALAQNEISLFIDAPYDMNSLKVTATSLRVPDIGECHANSEVKCFFNNQLYCMTSLLKCDGNVNCGVRNEYDEEASHCEEYSSITPDIIIVGLGIGFISLALLVSIIKTILPSRKETFIFKEDETLSEKDRATSQKYFNMKIKILHRSNDGRAGETVTIENRHVLAKEISFYKIRRHASKNSNITH